MLVLPGPGILVVALGFAILGTEYAWAAAALEQTKRAATAAGDLAKEGAGRVARRAGGLRWSAIASVALSAPQRGDSTAADPSSCRMIQIARTPAALFRQMRAQGRPLSGAGARAPGLRLQRVASTRASSRWMGHRSRCTASAQPASSPSSVRRPRSSPCPCSTTAIAPVTGATAGDPGAFPHRRAVVRARSATRPRRSSSPSRRARSARYGRSRTRSPPPPRSRRRERWRMLLELSEMLDKWDDGRVMYSADGRGDREWVAGHEAKLRRRSRSAWGAPSWPKRSRPPSRAWRPRRSPSR